MFHCLKSIDWPMEQTFNFVEKKQTKDSCVWGVNVKEREESINLLLTLKWNVFTVTAYKVVLFICLFLFRPSETNQYQSLLSNTAL